LVSDIKRGSYTERVLTRMVRIIFRLKRDEVAGGWRKLHNEELRDLYPTPSVIRIVKSRGMRWMEHVVRIGEKRNAYRLLVRKSGRKRLLGRPRFRWLDNIKMNLVRIGWGGMDWIGLAQDREKGSAFVSMRMTLPIL
jgi:hypothetical protein